MPFCSSCSSLTDTHNLFRVLYQKVWNFSLTMPSNPSLALQLQKFALLCLLPAEKCSAVKIYSSAEKSSNSFIHKAKSASLDQQQVHQTLQSFFTDILSVVLANMNGCPQLKITKSSEILPVIDLLFMCPGFHGSKILNQCLRTLKKSSSDVLYSAIYTSVKVVEAASRVSEGDANVGELSKAMHSIMLYRKSFNADAESQVIAIHSILSTINLFTNDQSKVRFCEGLQFILSTLLV